MITRFVPHTFGRPAHTPRLPHWSESIASSNTARLVTSYSWSSSKIPPANLCTGSPESKRPRLAADARMASTSTSNGIVDGAGSRFEHSDYGHFKLLQSFDVKYAPVRVGKWRSERTGLSVVVGSHEGESRPGRMSAEHLLIS